MDYLENLRHIINEINVGGKAMPEEPDEDNPDFMDNDDDGGDDAPTEQPDTDDGGGDDENPDFMDDGSSGGEETADSGEGETSDDENPDFMDNDDDGGDESSADDDSAGGDDENPDFMDDGGEGGDDTGGGEEGESSDEDNPDFMSDDGGGGEGGDDSSGGEEGESTDEDGEEQSEENNDYDINKIEDELFSSLTPEQIAIKNHELKNQFIELYSIIGSTLVRINDISKSNNNVNVLKFITEKLLELREMIDFNITTAYQTRTYIENNIIYQQCIATLNAIADIIDNIPKLDNKDEEEEETEDKGEPVEQDEESSDSLNISDSSMSDYQEESVNYYNNLL